MGSVYRSSIHNPIETINALERQGWRSYGKVAMTVDVVTDEMLDAVESTARLALNNLGISPALFCIYTRSVGRNGWMVTWVAAAPADKEPDDDI